MNEGPRFEKTAITAARFFIKYDIKKLPIDPFSIIARKSNWEHMTYKDFALLTGLKISEVIIKIGSVDGCAFYNADDDQYLILYNDNKMQIRTIRRMTWTIMHEIGHIELGHLKETGEAMITRAALGQEKYQNLEAEAEFFASMALAPLPVLYGLQIFTTNQIMDICGLSKKAAENRLNQLNARIKQKKVFKDERIIENHFHDFIHKKKCPRCGHGFISEDAIYCPICRRKVIWGDGSMIYDDGFKLNKDSKALQCPRCENEEISDEGSYCSICGVYLINKCSDIMESDRNGNEYIEKAGCSKSAAGNARYCIYCGNPTTFYQDKLLKSWDEVQKTEAKKMLKEAASTNENE